MKTLLLLSTLLISGKSIACSCIETFKTPYAHTIAKNAVVEKGYEALDSKVIKYKPTVTDRFFARNEMWNSCAGKLAGKPIHYCTEKFRGEVKVEVKSRNCFVIVKVNRKKYSYKSKIVKNTCN